MNNLLLTYTGYCILILSSIFILGYFTFIKKQINRREWMFVLIGCMLTGLIQTTISVGGDINDNLGVEFKVPNEIYSAESYISDSLLNDAILYTYLVEMRIPHPKIVLCQAKIESAQYQSSLFKRQNNLFGMKISLRRATSGVHGKAGYQNYGTWRESVTDYALWQYSHHVDQLSQDKYLEFLGRVYAEDPQYVNKIKSMMKTIKYKELLN